MITTGAKKKSKRAKKLDFTQEEQGFIFRPRKFVTRSMQQVEKVLEAPLSKTELPKKPSKQKKHKEIEINAGFYPEEGTPSKEPWDVREATKAVKELHMDD